ncbi:MAG: S-layer homology domain-containing protein, partial [Caldanaerobacter sp.]
MSKYLKILVFTMVVSLIFPVFGFAKVQPSFSFDDIKEYQWAIKAVEKMHAKGVIKGVGDKKFAPSKPVTHLEALALILRTLGYEGKTATLPKEYKGNIPSWGKDFIGLAYEKGLLTTEDLKTFNPNKDAKRYEIAKYLIRALGLEK